MYFYYIMSYSNGLLPSTSTSTNEPQRGLPGIGFKLTADGNFDINGKLLTNVAGPANGDDATNKNYVDTENAKQNIAIADKASKSDLNSKLNIDGSNSMTSDLNLNNNKVINISGGTNNGDAVNYGQLLSHSSNNHQNNYHLQKSCTFYKNFGDKAQLNIQNINITNHNHHDLLVVEKESYNSGFGGQAWVSLKMTNNLPAGDYTVIFEIFAANIVSASNITFLNHETLFQQVHGDANYKIITFSHDYQTTHSKSYIQFTTNGNARDITFEIRYYGSSYNNSNLNFLFYSRVVAGRIGYAFNHKIFDIDDVQLNNQILYFDDIQMNNNKIKGLAEPSEDSHAANMKYVNDQIQTQVNSLFSKNSHSYDLQPNFTFKSLSLSSVFHTERGGTLQHNHGRWYRVTPAVISGQYFVLNFSAQHNNLKPGNYTALFELFSLYNHSLINDVSTMTFDNTAANSNYKFIQLKSLSVDNNHKKIIMQFEVIRNPGVLNGKLKWRRILSHLIYEVRFVFFHRIIEGLYDLDFDHGVFDADPQQLFFIDSLSLNNKRLTDVADPTDPKDSVNKTYVDNEIAKLPHSDTGTLKLDGSRAMEGDLNMNNHHIDYLETIVEDDGPNPNYDQIKYKAVNFELLKNTRDYLFRENSLAVASLLPKDGSEPMTGDFNMANHFITNVKDPLSSNSNYAATVNFVNKMVSDNNTTISTLIDSKITEVDYLNIKAAKQENVFSFVMDDDLFKEDDSDITKIGKVDKDFYDIRKETYQFNINYDDNIGYYSTRTGIGLKAIDLGEYTLVFEMYFNETKIDKNEVIVNAVSTPLNISRNRTNKFADHSRTIINFHKYGNIGIIDLDIDITMKNKARIAYDPTTTIFVVVYGVSGHQNDVESSVWDRVYFIQNNTVLFEAAIDMNKHDIKNVDNLSMNKLIDINMGQIKDLGDGNENGDAVNVKQLNNVESNMGKYIKAEITKVDTSLKKYFNDQLNNTIAERGYQNSLICVFYLDNNQFNNGDKITNLPDKKSFMPIHDANQSVESRKPTADDDLNFSHMNYRAQQCSIVNYNLNGKNNMNVFIVFRILDSPGATLNGIFGNDNGGNDRYIAVRHNVTPKQLRIGYGNGRLDLFSFPSKANPLTLNFSVLSVHYNTPDENNSLVYCNGKYVINFTGETSTGENTFSIGSISSDPTNNTSLKHIAYFSLYHGRFSTIDIKRQHKYLCERYRIDHDPISVP